MTGLDRQFDALATTPTCPFAAVRHKTLPFYGVQFHPEVTHTPHGVELIRNFLYEICKCQGTWRMSDFMDSECIRIREQVGDARVICGLSGGVDSSVVAALLTKAIGTAAVRHKTLPFYGVQFHPEVTHTPHGVELIRNFLYEICKCQGTWRMSDFMDSECIRIREQVGDARVICGLSGGVDSSVVAALLTKAIGNKLSCIFVDNGLLRKNELPVEPW